MRNHGRRSTRSTEHDYTQPGWYAVTLCTKHRIRLFGNVVDQQMQLNDFGQIAHAEWSITPILRPYVTIDTFVVMPDHFHAILAIHLNHGGLAHATALHGAMGDAALREGMATPCPYTKTDHDVVYGHGVAMPFPNGIDAGMPTQREFGKPIAGSLGTIIGAFKSAVSYRVNKLRNTPRTSIWHRDYNDRVIRNHVELDFWRRYIEDNPKRWQHG